MSHSLSLTNHAHVAAPRLTTRAAIHPFARPARAIAAACSLALLLAACETTGVNTNDVKSDANPGSQVAVNADPGLLPGSKGALVGGTQPHFVVNVGDRVLFGYDQYDLVPEARAILDRQAAYFAQFGNLQVLVEGHCDERGTREYNLALGERRANAVRDYLIARGVAATRITTISYGKERPAVVASGEQSWAQNRRAVTVIR